VFLRSFLTSPGGERQPGCKQNAWSTYDGTLFRTRIGPNYAKFGKKDFSAASLYEAVAVDVFATPHGKVNNMPAVMDFSKYATPADCDGLPIPPLFVVHGLFPAYAPSLWGKGADDGPGYSLLWVFKLKPSTRAMLLKPESEWSPAVKLLVRFILQKDAADRDTRKRFKCIARVANADALPLGGTVKKLLNSYNGTPFLIRTSSRYYPPASPLFFSVDADIHKFSYMAKLGLNGLRDKFEQLLSEVAVVCQGNDDDELPEQILGSFTLSHLDLPAAAKWPEHIIAPTDEYVSEFD
jgi:hypothetical protein